jgi:alanine dehydrogenase
MQFGSQLHAVFDGQHRARSRGRRLLIGAVLVPGAAARNWSVASWCADEAGSVIVDISIDQGGCIETSRPTTHADPTYIEEGVVHYCVTNMPGAVARTSAVALNNATLPFVLAIADRGWRRALSDDPHLRSGLNVCRGQLTHPAVAHDLGLPLTASERALTT